MCSYKSIASQKDYPLSIFDINKRLCFSNSAFNELVEDKIQDVEKLVSKSDEMDSFLTLDSFKLYINQIDEYYIVLGKKQSSLGKLKSNFFNFKSSLFNRSKDDLKRRAQIIKDRVCEARDEFNNCVIKKKKEPGTFFGKFTGLMLTLASFIWIR